VNPKAKKGRRMRGRVGWALVGASSLLLAAWWWSGWHEWRWESGRRVVLLSRGVVSADFFYGTPTRERISEEEIRALVIEMIIDNEELGFWERHFDLWWWRWRIGGHGHFAAPLWMPAAIGLSAGAAVLRRSWRGVRDGACRGCGYDLRGLVTGVKCPECGAGGKAA
jgi:hypothetical protein